MNPNPVDQWTNAELARALCIAAVKSQMEVEANQWIG